MLKQLSTSAFFCAKRAYSNVTGKINARKYVLTKYFQGEPKQSDFKIVEEELPELKDGEILTEAEYLSVDPYMRAYMIGYKLPTDMIGGQVANNTAYFGVKEILYPKAGETIAITGAAGAVGSHVGQIGKILGCRVIGFAGTDEKCEYLQKELGFDHAFNYKTANIKTALREGAPNRIDCYFDNVGGEISSTIMGHMNKYGRVAVCGSISSYNDTTLPKVTILQPSIVFKELKVEGFLVNRWLDRWDEGIKANMNWLQEGKIKYEEKVYSGFDNMVEALVGILRGENTGKAVVKVK
ncbi:prostaglandin reductase 1-like isoform X2 [Leguminivora glycinivorella]|uniref:prostaglandin reductase 1-like isoform X2 n=1 Tax=Leguminivora glycinivorella TaxID=1035111 RepID=UPI0020102119|nr:prostaglandin reductase 1-like isoform X2 [Leguminivora glycinivorella]